VALFRTLSAAIQGIDAHVIDVEVDMYPAGTNRDFVTVGMPDAAVKESRERIKSALLNSGFGYPSKSVTINLAPANVRKEGAGFDLPMATAILGAMGIVSKADDYLIVGELSLDGSLRPVRGALSIAVCAARKNIQNLLVPFDNAAEAAFADALAASPPADKAAAIRNKRAIVAIKRGERPRAVDELIAALDADARCAAAITTVGNLLLEDGAAGEAIANYEYALLIDTEYGPAYHSLGVALLRAGRRREAVGMLRKATRLEGRMKR